MISDSELRRLKEDSDAAWDANERLEVTEWMLFEKEMQGLIAGLGGQAPHSKVLEKVFRQARNKPITYDVHRPDDDAVHVQINAEHVLNGLRRRAHELDGS